METWRLKGQLAGFVNPQELLSPRLRLTRGIFRPSAVTLSNARDEQWLIFEVPEDFVDHEPGQWGWTEVRKIDGMVDQFLRLETPGEVRRFAAQYGPIYICRAHTDMTFPVMCRWTGKTSSMRDGCRWDPWESVALWLACVRQAVGALRLIAQMQEGKPLHEQPEAWRDLMLISPGEEQLDASLMFVTSGKRPDLAKSYLFDWISGFPFDTWPMRLVLDEDGKLTTATGQGFLPVVWLVIAQTVSGSRTVQVCSGCGFPYMRSMLSRAPKAGQKTFCDKCGKKVDWAVSKKLSRDERIDQLRALGEFIVALPSPPKSALGDANYLRRSWNDRYPDKAYPTVHEFEKDLGLLVAGSYRAVTGRKLRNVVEAIKDRHGFHVDTLTSKEE